MENGVTVPCVIAGRRTVRTEPNSTVGHMKSPATIDLLPVAQSAVPEETRMDDERATDEIYFALSNYRRRFVLRFLQRTPDPVPLRTLSEELAAWENGVESTATTAVQRKRAYVALRQTHLPKLDELGLISYDETRGIARPIEGIEDADSYLASEETDDLVGPLFYAGIGGIVTLAILSIVFGVPAL